MVDGDLGLDLSRPLPCPYIMIGIVGHLETEPHCGIFYLLLKCSLFFIFTIYHLCGHPSKKQLHSITYLYSMLMEECNYDKLILSEPISYWGFDPIIVEPTSGDPLYPNSKC